MITLYRPQNYRTPRAPSFSGRSIDSKPINVENGATYYEIDEDISHFSFYLDEHHFPVFQHER